jgi:hypothetical protein
MEVNMDTATFVIVGLIALIVVIWLFARTGRSRGINRAALRPLTPEARDRYAAKWDQIESRFLEVPGEAVREADALILAMLGELGHPLAENRLPDGVRKARREASRGGTEHMRVAILHYRAVVAELGRLTEESERIAEGRRETA